MRTDPAAAALTQSLDVSQYRHDLLAGNLANLNTPGYVRTDIDFQGALADLDGDPAAHAVRGGPASLEKEVGEMASTDSFYESCARILSMRYQQLHTSVKER